MSAYVLDASVALSWCCDNEASAETNRLFEFVRDDGAAYLELAMRRGLKLLTRDTELASAALRHGIKVLPVPADPPKPGRPRRHAG
jgi:predicted nucleic acid-binding protein